MNAKLRLNDHGTQREESSQQIRRTEFDDLADDVFADCLQVFFAAGKPAKEVAWNLGLSESHLSEMRAGKRSVTLARLLRMFASDPASWLIFGQRIAARLGTEPPRRKREIRKSDVKRQLELEMRKAPQVVDLFLDKVARAFGADIEEVKDAWSETTGVHDLVAR